MRLNEYLDIPFVDGGRDFSGCDCYGLVRLIYKNELNIELPEFCGIGAKETMKIRNEVSNCKGLDSVWEKVHTSPIFGDIVLLKMNGAAVHVGFMLNKTKFIHTSENIDCSIESLSSSRWKTRIDGIYRHRNG